MIIFEVFRFIFPHHHGHQPRVCHYAIANANATQTEKREMRRRCAQIDGASCRSNCTCPPLVMPCKCPPNTQRKHYQKTNTKWEIESKQMRCGLQLRRDHFFFSFSNRIVAIGVMRHISLMPHAETLLLLLPIHIFISRRSFISRTRSCLGSSESSSSSSDEEESLIEQEDDATCRVVCIETMMCSVRST